MKLSSVRHPPVNSITISTAVFVITAVTSLHLTHAKQKTPTYHERFQLAADALSKPAKSDMGLDKSELDIQRIQSGLMQLSLREVQESVLQSIQELSGGDFSGAGEERNLQESVVRGGDGINLEESVMRGGDGRNLEESVVRGGDGRNLEESVMRGGDGINLEESFVGVGKEQAVQNTTSEICINHTAAVVVGLLERQGWALQMLDAMGKPSPGITEGNLLWPGAYQLCRKVRANTTVPIPTTFSGRYCTLRLVPAGGFVPGAAVVSAIMGTGICIPDTCSGMDMTILIDSVLASLNLTQQLKSLVLYADCQEPKTTLDAKAIVAIVICTVFLFFMVVGTAIDILFVQRPKWKMDEMTFASTNGYAEQDERLPLLVKPDVTVKAPRIGMGARIFLAFSVYTNGSKLLSTKQAPGSLTCVHGIRFLSMTWVVLGHAFIFPITFGAANTGPYLQEVITRWSFQAIANATVSVDTFFVLSGLLVTYLSLKEMKKKGGKINWFFFYFHRFWRLTPAYMLVIMVYVCLSPYWGEGPLWNNVNPDRDNCETSWWANILYINNLVRTDKQCLAQSWYLANDMQFYILSPLIFVPFYFSPIFGAVSSAVFLLITSVVPAALTMKEHFPPGILPGQLQGNESNTLDFMNDFYIKPYNRMGPYLVGMLAGYFLYRTNCTLHINKVVNLSAWALATGCALAVLYGLYDASNGHPITLPVSAFYNAVNRQVWGACVAWVVVACVTGNGGFVDTILSWSGLVPLSRLTYCIYLLHIMMMELYLMNTNTVFYMSDVNVVMFFLAALVVSYMAAAVTSLAFEAPMMMLEKVLFHPLVKKDDKKEENEQK